MYELKETPIAEPVQTVDTSNFITRNEFEDVINRMKNYLNSLSIEKTEPATASVPVNQEPNQRSFEF
jgi:hypothetical protein